MGLQSLGPRGPDVNVDKNKVVYKKGKRSFDVWFVVIVAVLLCQVSADVNKECESFFYFFTCCIKKKKIKNNYYKKKKYKYASVDLFEYLYLYIFFSSSI